jgi:hypothetical protein
VYSCDRVGSNVDIRSPYYERNWRSVNHKMALRPNIITDAALKVTFAFFLYNILI